MSRTRRFVEWVLDASRLDALVKVAFGPTEAIEGPSVIDVSAERRAALVALKQWYDEWRETARAVIKKKQATFGRVLTSAAGRRPRGPK